MMRASVGRSLGSPKYESFPAIRNSFQKNDRAVYTRCGAWKFSDDCAAGCDDDAARAGRDGCDRRGSPAAQKTLRVYFVDVEGGQATLFVTPAGQSLLIDTGWDGNEGRDADRIVAAAKIGGAFED